MYGANRSRFVPWTPKVSSRRERGKKWATVSEAAEMSIRVRRKMLSQSVESNKSFAM